MNVLRPPLHSVRVLSSLPAQCRMYEFCVFPPPVSCFFFFKGYCKTFLSLFSLSLHFFFFRHCRVCGFFFPSRHSGTFLRSRAKFAAYPFCLNTIIFLRSVGFFSFLAANPPFSLSISFILAGGTQPLCPILLAPPPFKAHRSAPSRADGSFRVFQHLERFKTCKDSHGSGLLSSARTLFRVGRHFLFVLYRPTNPKRFS